jgi:hypothetical protein
LRLRNMHTNRSRPPHGDAPGSRTNRIVGRPLYVVTWNSR